MRTLLSISQIRAGNFILLFLSFNIYENSRCSGSQQPTNVSSAVPKNGPNAVDQITQVDKSKVQFETRIAVRDGVSNKELTDMKTTVISEEAEGYFGMVKNSKMFADKSLLILHLLDTTTSKIKLISAPRKMGKSTNLDMIRLFATITRNKSGEIPLKDSCAYKHFRSGYMLKEKLLISQPQYREFVEKHQGKYSVIYIDFGKFKIKESTFQCINEEFKTIIREVFSQHDYLVNYWSNRLRNGSLETSDRIQMEVDNLDFNDILSGNETNYASWSNSISYLSRWLRNYVGKPIVIILDEYDVLIDNLYFKPDKKFTEEDEELIKDLHADFIKNTFRYNAGNFSVAILSGSMRIGKNTSLSGMNTVKEYDVFFAQDKLYPFYGFGENEVKELLTKRGLGTHEAKVKEWYKEYFCCSFDSTENRVLYNPGTIIRHVNTGVYQEYWAGQSGLLSFIKDLCEKYEIIRELMRRFMQNQTYKLDADKFRFDIEQCVCAKKLLKFETKIDSIQEDVMVSFLYNVGYLSLKEMFSKTDNEGKTKVIVRLGIVNQEICSAIEKAIGNY